MFKDRQDGAQKLLAPLKKLSLPNPVVVALPRGGVPMGDIVATGLNVPLQIVVPRKIGHPTNEEYAIGALVEEGEVIWNQVERAQVDDAWAKQAVQAEREEAQRRRSLYGLGEKRQSFKDKDVILIDDGIATGMTMRAAIATIKQDKPSSITVAVPVAAADSLEMIKKSVDQVICLLAPQFFAAVGNHYQQFSQTTDQEVVEIMKKH